MNKLIIIAALALAGCATVPSDCPNAHYDQVGSARFGAMGVPITSRERCCKTHQDKQEERFR